MEKGNRVVKEVIDLYRFTGWKKWFVSIRFWDAPFEELEKIVPKNGKIIDLGCGEGILANYLGISSRERRILGIEIDGDRLKDANRGLCNIEFKKGNVLKAKFPKADVILMVHLLHHLSSKEDQLKLLKKTKNCLTNGGKLVIVEVDNNPVIKYIISWLTDAFIVPILFEKKVYNFAFYYRKQREWKVLLKKIGFKVIIKSAHKGKPFSHVIFIATK